MRWAAGIAAVGVLAGIVGCGGGTGTPSRQSAQAPASSRPAATSQSQASTAVSKAPTQTGKALAPITATFSFIPNGYQAPYYAALARGYYKDQGLKVKFIKAVNPATSIQWLIGHKVDITEDDVNVSVDAITKGAPLKVVAVTMQRNAFGVVYRKANPLKSPTDLYGHAVGVPAGTDAQVYWDAFVAATHLNPSRIRETNISLPTEVGALGKGSVIGVSAASYSLVPAMEKKGIAVGFMSYQAYGVHGMANDIVVTRSLLSQHSAWVRKFLYATSQGYAFAQAHPNQAAADMVRYVPILNRQVTVNQLKLSLTLLHTSHTQGKPLGWQDTTDWKAHLAMMQKFAGLKHPLPLNDYYTNKYLPTTSVQAP